jgi:anti-sigma factor RsiW
MACPDELTLDLWLADALSSEEAAVVARHVDACAACSVATQQAHTLGDELHAALALDADELEYLADLHVARKWRTTFAPATPWWGWIAVVGVVAGFVAWLAVGTTFTQAFGFAIQVGVGSVLLNAALGFAFTIGQALLELIRNPMLGWSQPVLALFALALLVWPRQLIPQRSTHA